LTTQWPDWGERWYGVLLRILVAIWGLALGAIGVFAGYFTAVDWKTGESNWSLGAGLLILGGIAFAIYCLYGAFRPTRWSFLPATILFGLSVALGILTAVAELVRSLAS
jgi:hypothetical protein